MTSLCFFAPGCSTNTCTKLIQTGISIRFPDETVYWMLPFSFQHVPLAFSLVAGSLPTGLSLHFCQFNPMSAKVQSDFLPSFFKKPSQRRRETLQNSTVYWNFPVLNEQVVAYPS